MRAKSGSHSWQVHCRINRQLAAGVHKQLTLALHLENLAQRTQADKQAVQGAWVDHGTGMSMKTIYNLCMQLYDR